MYLTALVNLVPSAPDFCEPV